jgi:hypothetical protein
VQTSAGRDGASPAANAEITIESPQDLVIYEQMHDRQRTPVSRRSTTLVTVA